MTLYQKETIEIIRRATERGLSRATKGKVSETWKSEFCDIFQHILNEIEILKRTYE